MPQIFQRPNPLSIGSRPSGGNSGPANDSIFVAQPNPSAVNSTFGFWTQRLEAAITEFSPFTATFNVSPQNQRFQIVANFQPDTGTTGSWFNFSINFSSGGSVILSLNSYFGTAAGYAQAISEGRVGAIFVPAYTDGSAAPQGGTAFSFWAPQAVTTLANYLNGTINACALGADTVSVTISPGRSETPAGWLGVICQQVGGYQ